MPEELIIDEAPAEVLPEAYYFTTAEGDYEALWAGLNEAGGYITAATEDEDGNPILEADRVWVQSTAPTNQAIPSPDEVKYVDGEAILTMPSNRVKSKYLAVYAPALAAGNVKMISEDEMSEKRDRAGKRTTDKADGTSRTRWDHKANREHLKTLKDPR